MAETLKAAVFLSVNLAAALLIYLGVGATLEALRDQQREIALIGERIARSKSLSLRDIELASLAPNETLRITKRYLQGDTIGLVSADLLRRVNAVVEQEGGAVSAVSSLPELEWRGRHLVGVQVDLIATDLATANILLQIETGDCLLFVRRARLAPATGNVQGASLLQAKVEIWGATQW